MKEIQLSQGKVALVDDEDYEWLNKHKWSATKCRNTFYAVRHIRLPNGKQRTIQMHRVILGLESGDKRQGDHRYNNGLDNRRDKLRICTCSQNHQNGNSHRGGSSAFKGVSWRKDSHKWRSYIQVERCRINLGLFTSEVEAAKVYDQAARKYFGRFANLNFPEGRQACAS